MSEPQHQPRRPDWGCEDCDRDWPCDPARERLTAEMGSRTQLAILMVSYLLDFCQDQPSAPAGEAFERFISWTRPLLLVAGIR